MNATTHSQSDILTETREILQKPSKNTKRKILFSVNVTVVSVILLHFIVQLTTFGRLPDPARDMIVFPIVLLFMLISAIYNGWMLFKRKDGHRFLNITTAWSSVLTLQVFSLSIVHSNPNTATSLLMDFALSTIMIFITGTVLNRKMAVFWFFVAACSLYLAYIHRGVDFEYHLMTSQEVTEYKSSLSQKVPSAIRRMNEVRKERLLPLSSGLFVTVWTIFLLLTFWSAFFQAGMIDQVLAAIPLAVNKISVAAEEKQKLQKENLRMGAELDVAKRVQTMVLPTEAEKNACPGLEVGARMDTAAEVGGDFYEILPMNNGKTYFAIGDVTDHGLQSGVVMLMAQSVYRASLEEEKVDLKRSMQNINNVLVKNIQVRMNDTRNMTLCLGCYETGRLECIGQHEKVLIHRKADGEIEAVDTLDMGIYVGLLDKIDEHLQVREFHLEVGDTVLFYTDGVTEAEREKDKEMFEFKNLKNSLKKHVDEKTVQNLVDRIVSDVYAWVGEGEIMDDITLLAFRRKV